MQPIVLRIQYANGRVEDRGFAPGRYDVGREAGAIVLGDPDVSSRHAVLDVEPGRVVVTDAGSTNGTYDANGQRLAAPYALIPGGPVRLGRSALTLLAPAASGGTRAMPQVAPAQASAPAAPAPSRSPIYKPNAPSFVGGGRTFEYNYYTGTAVKVGKGFSTQVYSSTTQGPGGTSVSSSTTVHDDLFLVDSQGRERAFQLAGFDLAAREGHLLTVVWAIEKGASTGPYFVVGNHTTNTLYFHRKALQDLFSPFYIRGQALFLNIFLCLTLVWIPVFLGLIFLGAAKRDGAIQRFKKAFVLVPEGGGGAPLQAAATADTGGVPLWVAIFFPITLPLVWANPNYTVGKKLMTTVQSLAILFLLATLLMKR